MSWMIGIGLSVESSTEQDRMVKTIPNGVLTSATSSTETRPPHQLGGAHRLGAPYSSHRAPQRVRLRCGHRLRPCPRNGASRRAGVGWVRTSTVLTILPTLRQFLFASQHRLRMALGHGACLCMLLRHAVLARSLYPRPALDRHACKY